MTEEQHQLIEQWLSRARGAIEEAEMLLANQHLSGAVNRTYDACFYAVTALLLTEDQQSDKHSGVLALFDRHWISTQRLPREMGRFYHEVFGHRQLSEQADTLDLGSTSVQAWLTEAEQFIELIAAEIAKSTA